MSKDLVLASIFGFICIKVVHTIYTDMQTIVDLTSPSKETEVEFEELMDSIDEDGRSPKDADADAKGSMFEKIVISDHF